MQYFYTILVGAIASISFSSISISVSAQRVPDGTTATSILSDHMVRGDLANYITGGNSLNNNLIHSFSEFNVDAGERVYFQNPTAINNIITRVTGINSSDIFGTLGVDGTANLFLINPNGITLGSEANLDLRGSFFATTATDIEFDNGSLLNIASAEPNALLSINPNAVFPNALRNYQNNIQSFADLTVGDEQSLSFAGNSVEVDGLLSVQDGRIETFGNTINFLENAEIVATNGLVVIGDIVFLTSEKNAYVVNDGQISAQDIQVNARTLINYGSLDVSGETGGNINADVEYFVNNNGTIRADGIAGDGGRIEINASERIVQNDSSLVSATGSENGGDIYFFALTHLLSGDFDVSGAKGGSVEILGDYPSLMGTRINASGDFGGGKVWAGGAYQGGSDIYTATNTTVSQTTAIEANAIVNGNGGEVIVWADNHTNFAGSVNARGGEFGGDGGFVEVSGKNGGSFAGMVDASAKVGNAGIFLLDPKNITIADGGIESTLALATTYFKPPPISEDFFGLSVAIDENYVLIGASGDDTGARNSGSAYLFDVNGSFLQTLNNPTPEDFELFGSAIAIDNENILIGSRGDNTGAISAGSAYLFDVNGSLLQTFNNPTPEDFDLFGGAVAIDNENILIGSRGDNTGAMNTGSAYLFDTDGSLIQTFNNPTSEIGDSFGRSVALDNNNVLIGADGDNTGGIDAGSAYLFDTDGLLLQTFNSPAPSEGISLNKGAGGFGWSVAIDDNSVLVGDPGSDIGATDAGSAYLFDTNGNLIHTFDAPTPAGIEFFGWSVAVDQENIVIGASRDQQNAGSVYLFDTNANLRQTLNNPMPGRFEEFGSSVAVRDGKVVVGAPFSNSVIAGGSAYLYSEAPTLYNENPTDSFVFDADFITNITDTGTNLLLQANTDITVDEAIITNNQNGIGGALEFNVGRSIFINADITTDNGNLTLVANDTLANGVIDAEREPGLAEIFIDPTVRIDAGVGDVEIFLRDGEGLTYNDNGSVVVGAIAANNLLVNSEGDITQNAPQNISGLASFRANNHDINLPKANDFNQIVFERGDNIFVNDKNDLEVRDSNIVNNLNFGNNLTIRTAGNLKTADILNPSAVIDLRSFNGNIDTSAGTISNAIPGRSGRINITADQGDIFLGDVKANSSSLGDSEINVQSPNGSIFASGKTVRNFSNERASNINLSAQLIRLDNGTVVEVGTANANTGGNIRVTETEELQVLNGSRISASTLGNGDAGNINIDVQRLLIRNNTDSSTGIGADTDFDVEGSAGKININASESITIIGNEPGPFVPNTLSFSSVVAAGRINTGITSSTFGRGDAGELTVKTGDLIIRDRAAIASAALNFTPNGGDSGLLNVTANNIDFQGLAGLSISTLGGGNARKLSVTADQITLKDGAAITADTVRTASGNAGDIEINVRRLNVLDGSRIGAATANTGKGGLIDITATESIEISGVSTDPNIPSGIFSEALEGSSGAAGNIDISTPKLRLNDRATIAASTDGVGRAGRIDINALQIFIENNSSIKSTTSNGIGGKVKVIGHLLHLANSSQISTSTSGGNAAGNIDIQIRDEITLSGADTGLFASTTAGSTGNGGSIKIDPIRFNISDGAAVAVDSNGTGIGGNVEIFANLLNLNKGRISAETLSTDGGNLSLNISDYIFLENNSNITTTAGTAQAGGNGGNIKITTPFVIAMPGEDSNILSQAFEGDGGNILIEALELFQIGFTGEDIPVRNDINVSSTFGREGTVEIASPEVDPASGLNELPSDLVDADSLIGQNACAVENDRIAGGSELVVTGKGGIPTTPEGSSGMRNPILSYLTNPENIPVIAATTTQALTSDDFEPETNMAIAQGWQRLPDGKVQLISSGYQTRQDLVQHPHCVAQEN